MAKYLLKFHPEERITVKECLQNPMFDRIRNKNLEKDAKCHVKLPLDDELTMNYDAPYEDYKSLDYLIGMLSKEIEAIKNYNM